MLAKWEAEVAAHGAARLGIVATTLLVIGGMPYWVAERLRQRGLLVSVGRGVDRLRDHPFGWEARCRAALDLAGPGAVLAGSSAARLHGFYRYRESDEIVVTVLRGRDQRTTLGRIIQTRWLPAEHITFVNGLPVTTAARTFFDLAGHPPGRMSVNHLAHYRHMYAVYNDCVARRGLTFHQEAAVLLVMAKRGRAGTRLVRRILQECGANYVPTHSDVETLFAIFVRTYDLPEPDRQVTVSGEQGFIGVVDFCWPKARLIVEVDSRWHDGPLDEEHDEDRDRDLEAAGYTVRRVRYGEIVGQPAALAAELGVAVRRYDRPATPS